MSLKERIDTLERQLGFYKRLTIITPIAIVLLMLMGAGGNPPQEEETNDIITAKQFVLLDDKGKEVGKWFANDTGTFLNLRDANEQVGVQLKATFKGSPESGVRAWGYDNRAELTVKGSSTQKDKAYSSLRGGVKDGYFHLVAGHDMSSGLRLLQEGGYSRVGAEARGNKAAISVKLGQREESMVLP